MKKRGGAIFFLRPFPYTYKKLVSNLEIIYYQTGSVDARVGPEVARRVDPRAGNEADLRAKPRRSVRKARRNQNPHRLPN